MSTHYHTISITVNKYSNVIYLHTHHCFDVFHEDISTIREITPNKALYIMSKFHLEPYGDEFTSIIKLYSRSMISKT